MDFSRTLAATFSIVLCAAGAVAQELPKIEPLLPELTSPVAMTIRPGGNAERHELLVADGAGRIVRVASDAFDQPLDIVAGSGKSPTAMLFLNSRTFIVATDDVPPELRAYEIPEEDKSLAADQTKFEVRAAAETRCNVRGMTLGPTALFVVGFDDDAGWILRSRVRSSVPGDLKPFVNTREKGGGSQPTCVDISTRGWVVVGDAGQRDASEDSRLTFYHPTDSEADPALTVEPGLLDVSAIAYSPQGGLFAADFAEADPQRGGIYRIDMDYQANTIDGKVVRVVPIERPTAITFAPDGTLYVVAQQDDNGSGKLFRISAIE